MMTEAKTEDLRKLIGRCDKNCLLCFQGATSVCASRAQFEITPEHLLLRLLDDTGGDVTRIFDTFKVDRSQIRRALQRILAEMPTGHKGKPALSPKIVELFQSAAVMADEFGFDKIRTGLMILAFALNPAHTRVANSRPRWTASTSTNCAITFTRSCSARPSRRRRAPSLPSAPGRSKAVRFNSLRSILQARPRRVRSIPSSPGTMRSAR